MIRSPPALAQCRDPAVANDQVDQPLLPLRIFSRKSRQAPARRRHSDRCEDHLGQADVRREAETAIGLGRQVEAGKRLASDLASARNAKLRVLGRLHASRIGGDFPKAEPLAFMDDETAFGVAFRSADSPSTGRRLAQ